jgi:hypothetical protein
LGRTPEPPIYRKGEVEKVKVVFNLGGTPKPPLKPLVAGQIFLQSPGHVITHFTPNLLKGKGDVEKGKRSS